MLWGGSVNTQSAESPAHQPLDIGSDRRVAYQELVATEHPQVRGRGYRTLRQLGYRILIRESIDRVLIGEQLRQFLILEAYQVDVETLFLQCRQFNSQKLLIPAGVQRELVVGNDVRTLLSFREMVQDDYGHLFELQLARCEEATAAGKIPLRPTSPKICDQSERNAMR